MIAELLLLLGSLFFLVAALGLFRMPDAIARLHAATKASSLGVIVMMLAAMIRFPEPFVFFLGCVTLFLIFLTAPLASHAIAIRVLKRD